MSFCVKELHIDLAVRRRLNILNTKPSTVTYHNPVSGLRPFKGSGLRRGRLTYCILFPLVLTQGKPVFIPDSRACTLPKWWKWLTQPISFSQEFKQKIKKKIQFVSGEMKWQNSWGTIIEEEGSICTHYTFNNCLSLIQSPELSDKSIYCNLKYPISVQLGHIGSRPSYSHMYPCNKHHY